MLYDVRYVHKIRSSASDISRDVEIPDSAFADRKTLGAALRDAGVLVPGASVRSFRVEGDKIVIFPSRLGNWHAIVLMNASK